MKSILARRLEIAIIPGATIVQRVLTLPVQLAHSVVRRSIYNKLLARGREREQTPTAPVMGGRKSLNDEACTAATKRCVHSAMSSALVFSALTLAALPS